MTYISSQSLILPLQQSSMNIQSKMAQINLEVSSGNVADIGLSLGAHTGTSLSLQSEVDRLNSYTNSNSLATTRLAATSNSLSTMLTSAQNMSETLTEATGVGGTSTLQSSAQDALENLTGMLNTSTGGQFIFGGINTNTTPLRPTRRPHPPRRRSTRRFNRRLA